MPAKRICLVAYHSKGLQILRIMRAFPIQVNERKRWLCH